LPSRFKRRSLSEGVSHRSFSEGVLIAGSIEKAFFLRDCLTSAEGLRREKKYFSMLIEKYLVDEKRICNFAAPKAIQAVKRREKKGEHVHSF
jgi:hypothetical protein